MESLEKLQQIYREYLAAMEENGAKNAGLRGILNTLAYGPGGRDYSSLRFAEKVQELLQDAQPEPAERKAIFDFMLDAAWEQRDDSRVAMMLTAVHGCLIPLTKGLDSQQARELLLRYDSLWPRKLRTPVMQDFARSLEECCKACVP